ncbi:hypothetical protein Hanom_Chr16g01443031 [Helianthus anomalus]
MSLEPQSGLRFLKSPPSPEHRTTAMTFLVVDCRLPLSISTLAAPISSNMVLSLLRRCFVSHTRDR